RRVPRRAEPPAAGLGAGPNPSEEAPADAAGASKTWRRGRDSNPRYRQDPYTCFPGTLLKPLGHLSTSGPQRGGRRPSYQTGPPRPRSPRRAGRAGTVERQGGVAHLEPAGKRRALEDRDGAGRVELVDAAAVLAAEVVVVRGALGLVAGCRLVRQVHDGHLAALRQGAQVAVHGRQAQAGVVPRGALEHLLGRQRAGRLLQRPQDRPALRGLVHDGMVPTPARAVRGAPVPDAPRPGRDTSARRGARRAPTANWA